MSTTETETKPVTVLTIPNISDFDLAWRKPVLFKMADPAHDVEVSALLMPVRVS